MRIAIAIVLSALMLLPLVPAASAHNCNASYVTVPVGGNTFYVQNRATPDKPVDVWTYQESNGVPGLQVGGTSIVLGGLDVDDCHGSNPDTLIV